MLAHYMYIMFLVTNVEFESTVELEIEQIIVIEGLV